MKILHISPSYKPAYIYGGPIVSVSQLCKGLANLQCKVTVFTTTANGDKELDVKTEVPIAVENIPVFYFKRLTKDHTHFSPRLLMKLWREAGNYDIIHIHSWWNMVAILSTLICWLKGIRPILSPRGMLSEYSFKHENSLKKKFIHYTLGTFLLKKTILHATSRSEENECKLIHANWQSFVLPNIITLPNNFLVDEIYRHQDTSLKIIYLSRIDKKKGLELTFEALSEVNFDFRLQIFGTGEKNYISQLQNLSKQLKIYDKIQWMGWTNGEEKFSHLSSADLFILISQNENFANVVIEALSVGMPVLVSDKVGLYDYVQEKNLGWVTSLDKQIIIDNLQLVKEDKIKREFIKVNGAKIIYNDFSTITLSTQYLHIYKTIKEDNCKN